MPRSGPNLFLRPKAALLSSPRGSAFGPPFSFVPHCAQRSGGPFLFHRLRSPHTGAPCVGRRTRGAAQMGRGGFAAEKRTGRWSGPRENAPGGQSRHFCGNAVRHRTRAARDLPARPVPRKTAGAPGMERPEFIPSGSPPHHARRGMEPCSPVNPFFLDGGFWLGESASRRLSGGVGGAFYASGGAVAS